MTIRHLYVPALAIASMVSNLLPVVVGVFFRKRLSRGSKLYLALLIFYIPVLILQFTLLIERINNTWILHFYTLIECWVVLSMYSVESSSETLKNLVKWLVYFYSAIWLIAKFTVESFTLYDNYTSTLAALLMVMFAMHGLIDLQRQSGPPIFRKSQFWISTGILIYSVGTMPLFSIANVLLRRPLEEFEGFWAINWSLTILANLIYTKAFTCKP